MLLAAILSTALAVPPPEAVTDASADDCAIVVAIGRAEMNWGPGGPNLPFVAKAPDAHGVVYRQSCPWRVLGVGPPAFANPASPDARFSIDRPTYASDRRTAETDLAILGPSRRNGGAPFTRIEHCRLEKAGRRWRLLACVASLIN